MSGMHIGGIFGSAAALALVVAIAPPAHATTATAAEVSAVSSAGKGAPEVGAKEAYLVDSAGTIHLGKRQTRKVPVASLVKVMTAYVVLREARLTDTITIKQADVKHALDNGATTAALKKGEKMTVRDLLYGLMLPSGADAANALARTYGPGNKAFVAKMNAAAKTLGLASTRYTNADGLPSPPGAATPRPPTRPSSRSSRWRTRRSGPWSRARCTRSPSPPRTARTPGATPTSCSAGRASSG